MIKREPIIIRGRKLIRTYSDIGVKIHKYLTDEIYDEAIDLEDSPYVYVETNIPIEDITKLEV